MEGESFLKRKELRQLVARVPGLCLMRGRVLKGMTQMKLEMILGCQFSTSLLSSRANEM